MRIERTGLFVLALLVALLVGSLASSAAPVQLIFWHGYGAGTPYADAIEAVVDRFNELHPDIQVSMENKVPGGFFFDNYQVAILGGSPPDAMWMERSIIANLARKGMLEPMTGVFEVKESDYLPAPYAEVVWQGQTWAYPWATDIRGLFWNVDTLNEMGLNSVTGPTTWAEYNDWNVKLIDRDGNGQLTRVGDVPWGGNWFLAAWTWAFGGDLFDAENRKATFTSTAALEAVTWLASYRNYFTQADLTPLAARGDLFATGAQTLIHTGPAAIPVYQRLGPNLHLGFGPQPAPPGGRNGTWGGGHAIAVPDGSPHPQEARIFAQWMGSAEAQSIWGKFSGVIPTNREAALEFIEAQPAELLPMYDQMNDANIRYHFVWLPVFNGGLEVYNLLNQGNLSPQAILEQVQPTVQSEIDAIFAE